MGQGFLNAKAWFSHALWAVQAISRGYAASSACFSHATDEFGASLPRAINTVLEQMANNRLKVHVEAIDETRLILGLKKIANRITLGLLPASLIIGAGLPARTPTSVLLTCGPPHGTDRAGYRP